LAVQTIAEKENHPNASNPLKKETEKCGKLPKGRKIE
jgi:hypothetical protein